MAGFMEKLLLMGLGGVSMAQDGIKEAAYDMVRRGELTRDEAQSLVRSLEEKGRRERDRIDAAVSREVRHFLEKADVATKADIRRLERRLTSLEEGLTARQVDEE